MNILEKPYSAIVMSLISHESSIFEMLHNMISRIIHFGIFMCNFIFRYTCDVDTSDKWISCSNIILSWFSWFLIKIHPIYYIGTKWSYFSKLRRHVILFVIKNFTTEWLMEIFSLKFAFSVANMQFKIDT